GPVVSADAGGHVRGHGTTRPARECGASSRRMIMATKLKREQLRVANAPAMGKQASNTAARNSRNQAGSSQARTRTSDLSFRLRQHPEHHHRARPPLLHHRGEPAEAEPGPLERMMSKHGVGSV